MTVPTAPDKGARFELGTVAQELRREDTYLVLGPGLEHDVYAQDDSAFLLTPGWPSSSGGIRAEDPRVR